MFTKNALLLFLFVMVALLPAAEGQRQKHQKFDVSLGVGVFPTFLKDQGRMITPPLSLRADYRPAANLSMGFFMGYSSTETNKPVVGDENLVRLRNRFSSVGVRLAAHTTRFEFWDIYGGLSAGYMLSDLEVLEGNPDKMKQHAGITSGSGRMVLTGFVGSRFKLGPHMGAFAELGFGVSLLQTGLSYRF